MSGLLERGFEVMIGQHEVELPTEVPHIYTDPHWRTDPHWPDTLVAGLGRRELSSTFQGRSQVPVYGAKPQLGEVVGCSSGARALTEQRRKNSGLCGSRQADRNSGVPY